MEEILDELKQYDLKRIDDIENIDFDEYDCTLNNKFYLFVQFQNNIIISTSIDKRINRWNLFACLRNNQEHSYEIEHNFEMQYIYDIFYNFCLNNFASPTTHIKQLCMHLQTSRNNITYCEIGSSFDDVKKKFDWCENEETTEIKTISNLNELHLFCDAINEHENSTFVQVSFEQN